MQTPRAFQIVPLRGKRIRIKGRTCPSTETHTRDSPDREYSGNKEALCVEGVLPEIWLFVARDNLCTSFSPHKLAAAPFSRRVEVNKDILRVNPECRRGHRRGFISSVSFRGAVGRPPHLREGSGSDPSNGNQRNCPFWVPGGRLRPLCSGDSEKPLPSQRLPEKH